METKSKLLVSQLVKRFGLDVVMNQDYLNNPISTTGISRVGIELTGEVLFKEIISIVYFGSKESRYLSKFSASIIRKKLQTIIDLKPPLILLGKHFWYADIVLDIAKEACVPIVKTKYSFYELNFTINSYISQKLSHQSLVHGTLLNIYGVGVVLRGVSGIGKSEIAIELIKKGHIFVADDAIIVNRIGYSVYGRADDKTKDFIEIRGLGIINFSRSFGIERMIDSTKIEIVIELVMVKKDQKYHFERFGRNLHYKNFEGVNVVHYMIPVIQGRSIADIIETAVTDYKLKKAGYNSADQFIKQQINNKED
ncbi:HPr(Ser) kinase/phosphatase [Ureaplasma zalophigenitalium]|uniref:HPr kinase/phosphorylase n=1 Tax=Ureaplasma zalophigenitalium TaxID=907723 RepID=A0ABT3BPU8_9BACT|nr:HPr(Ser) kinase/phosphatase [Ureaplasma zalophigenitalium]MCV3754259.1 HPr(Ser) kinase/phosphatase [Ureaplasma zalophigenitalium]